MEPADFIAPFPGELLTIGAGLQAFVPAAVPQELDLPPRLQIRAAEAERAIGRLGGLLTGGGSPLSHHLVSRPLARQEAIESSRVEGTFTTPEQLVLFEDDNAVPDSDDSRESTLEVQNCMVALDWSIAQLDDGDSFFATVDKESTGRLYVGVAAPGRALRAVSVRTYATLLAAAAKHFDRRGEPKQPADPYMTLVGYFNSLRELGGMRRLVEEEVSNRVKNFSEDKRPHHYVGPHPRADDGKLLLPAEPTSRASTEAVKDTIRRLNVRRANEDDSPLDTVLASSMISVELNVDRLGLMVVTGQPKTTSEYIQATSRVGRAYPGLVVTCLNGSRPRDRSHYERFCAYHESFDREVEATSVTPFSLQTLDRGMVGTLISIVRCRDCEACPQPMSQATVLPFECYGDRPWLGGKAAAEPCGEQPRLLIRTASNAYFAQVVSALRLPEALPNRLTVKLDVKDIWDRVKEVSSVEELQFLAKLQKEVRLAFEDEELAEVLAAIDTKRGQGAVTAEVPLRSAEYERLLTVAEETPGVLAPEGALFAAYEVPPQRAALPSGLSKLVIVPELREVRVQVSFSRFDSVSANLQGEYEFEKYRVRPAVPMLPTGNKKWFPAAEVRGEGVFIEFARSQLHCTAQGCVIRAWSMPVLNLSTITDMWMRNKLPQKEGTQKLWS